VLKKRNDLISSTGGKAAYHATSVEKKIRGKRQFLAFRAVYHKTGKKMDSKRLAELREEN